ncbi:hypothetical protein [Niabella aurantiaca]|uniref:hypothetical protein n=1 Tax=Niabella aurantiaca TaxID=379900 RepID=UPI0003722969|nr:hypothetical protein [Niabella aurantiaca]
MQYRKDLPLLPSVPSCRMKHLRKVSGTPAPFFRREIKWVLLIYLLGSGHLSAFCQFQPLIKKLAANDSINTNLPREKIFIHYDRPYYNVKDTLWMKGYILSASENAILDSTGIAYIEVINASNEIVKRTAAPCYWGRFQSNIVLTEDDFPQGSYVLRAYTNWMRNFGDSLFFESRFTVINPVSGAWNARVHDLKFSGSRITLLAELTTNSLRAIAYRKVAVRVRSKNRNLLRIQTITDAGGNLSLDTVLKSDATNKDLVIEIADKEDLKLQIPVKAADQSVIDLQFLPEGGSFIAGRKQQLGFKAVNLYGNGVDVKGIIKNDQGQEIARFASIHKGMGAVTFTPQPGDHYTAFPEGALPVKLPDAKQSGTLLQVINDPASDSIQVNIDATADLHGEKCYFTGTTRGNLFAKGSVALSAVPHSISIAKSMLPSGITRFTLYNSLMQPVNERAVFIWQNDSLRLSLTASKEVYRNKDSVSLLLTVKGGADSNTTGSFSVAVIDTSQVGINQQAENILSYMLLSSDLKGHVEEPYYYFRQRAPDAADALMLTQGWVHYEWPPGGFHFDREDVFKISGKASNIFNKPFANTKVVIFGKVGRQGVFLLDTITNNKGIFTFDRFPYFSKDSVSLVIEAFNRKGRAFNIGIDLHEPEFPPYTGSGTAAFEHQNILLDTATAQFVRRQMAIRNLIKKHGEYLDEVVVKTTAAIPGSKNLNKNGGADQVIYEKTLDKMPKETLLSVLYKQVKGFGLGSLPRSNNLLYLINGNIVRFIIDGVDLHFFYDPGSGGGGPNDYQLFLDAYLKYFSAEDIRAIEIMNTPKFNSPYRSSFLSIQEQMNSGPVTRDYSFVEITTRSGSGPFLKKTPGIYLYRPVVPVLAKQFYSPRYMSPDEKTAVPDLRTTVYWNPEVMTNKDGKARFSFYTSESSSNYMIIVQGANLTGKLGVLYQPLAVQKNGE